jgi:hypothetical protein
MAIKEQTNCFRTIQGKRFINWCDLLCAEHEAEIAKVKAAGIPHRIFRHPAGFRRLFVLETEAHRIN